MSQVAAESADHPRRAGRSRALHLVAPGTPADALEQLALLTREDETVVCLGGADPPAALDEQVVRLHLPVTDRLGLTRRCRCRLRDADVVHGWSAGALPATAAVARAMHRPAVCSLACLDPRELTWPQRIALRYVTVVTLPWVRPVSPTAGRATSPLAHGPRSPSAGDRPSHAHARGSLWDRIRVEVLPPAVEVPPRDDGLRRRAGISDDAFVLAAPGDLHRRAGQDLACWAAAILREAGLNAHLLLSNRGPDLRHVRYFAAMSGHGEAIHFRPESIARLIAASDAAVLLHRRPAGPVPAATALAAGVPLVAARTGDLVAVCEARPWASQFASDGCEQGRAGPPEQAVAGALFVPRGDPREAAGAVLRLTEQPGLRVRLSEAGRTAAERFSPRRVRERLTEIYRLAQQGGAIASDLSSWCSVAPAQAAD